MNHQSYLVAAIFLQIYTNHNSEENNLAYNCKQTNKQLRQTHGRLRLNLASMDLHVLGGGVTHT